MRESEVIRSERIEWQSARDAQDRGGNLHTAGVVVEEWPSADEIGELL